MLPWQGPADDQESPGGGGGRGREGGRGRRGSLYAKSSGLSSFLYKIEVCPMASLPIPPQPFFIPFIFLKPESELLEKAGPHGPLPYLHWPRAQPSHDLSELGFPGLVGSCHLEL